MDVKGKTLKCQNKKCGNTESNSISYMDGQQLTYSRMRSGTTTTIRL
ncbi:hypothetical protein [Thermomonospora umbrina]|uniref:Uncharacterized protein n=1 Tax=Thermomonospora umbrina TaxID=111806 RepID=A0A3D9T1X0_9ACTN|nr:hypothetical protein [Thermomonospora umbrina]REF00334.1 hypothetical protein DFJ69_5866 [Thermomonospora umbrina]